MKKYYTYIEIASALSKSVSTIRNRSKDEGWQFIQKPAPGTPLRLFLYDALPDDVQNALQEQQRKEDELAAVEEKAANVKDTFTYDPEELEKQYEKASNKKKAKAQRKLTIINYVLHLSATMPFGEAIRVVSKMDEIRESEATIRSWWYGANGKPGLKDYQPQHRLVALIPQHTGRTAKADYNKTALLFLKSHYLTPEQRSVTRCWRDMMYAAKLNGWVPPFPSLRTSRRKLMDIPRPLRILEREGPHALMMAYPSMLRTVLHFDVMEAVNGDGYKPNDKVDWPGVGEIRPIVIFWQDLKSRYILSYGVDSSENTTVIQTSFADFVLKYGIPKKVYIDNGRAFASDSFTGGVPNRYRNKVSPDDPMGILPLLGCEVHWTSVPEGHGNGRAKPIERAFKSVGGIGEMLDKAPEFEGGAYTGTSPMNKPYNYGSKVISYETFIKVLDREVARFNAQVDRDTEAGEKKYSFADVFAEGMKTAKIRPATPFEKRLLLTEVEVPTVRENGTFSLKAGSATGVGTNRYEAEELMEYAGQKVSVRFDPNDLHGTVIVHNLKGEWICDAKCTIRQAFDSKDAARDYQKELRHKIKHWKGISKAEERMTNIERAQLLGGVDDVETVDIPSPKVIAPVFHQPKKERTFANDAEMRDEAFVRAVAKLEKASGI